MGRNRVRDAAPGGAGISFRSLCWHVFPWASRHASNSHSRARVEGCDDLRCSGLDAQPFRSLPMATCGNAFKIIPHIFREQRPRAAQGGVRLHSPETINGA